VRARDGSFVPGDVPQRPVRATAARGEVGELERGFHGAIVGGEQRARPRRVRRAPDVLEQERVVEVGQLDVAQARPHAERHPDERGAQDVTGGLTLREVEREREGADHLGQRRPSHGARIR
jgi:hypothetical protein